MTQRGEGIPHNAGKLTRNQNLHVLILASASQRRTPPNLIVERMFHIQG